MPLSALDLLERSVAMRLVIEPAVQQEALPLLVLTLWPGSVAALRLMAMVVVLLTNVSAQATLIWHAIVKGSFF